VSFEVSVQLVPSSTVGLASSKKACTVYGSTDAVVFGVFSTFVQCTGRTVQNCTVKSVGPLLMTSTNDL
jgi:hypothetical protein